MFQELGFIGVKKCFEKGFILMCRRYKPVPLVLKKKAYIPGKSFFAISVQVLGLPLIPSEKPKSFRFRPNHTGFGLHRTKASSALKVFQKEQIDIVCFMKVVLNAIIKVRMHFTE